MARTVEDIAIDIETMKIRGAHRIAQAAAGALVIWAQSHEGPLEPSLSANVKRLIGPRPTAVSLRNALVETLTGIEPKKMDEESARYYDHERRRSVY